MYNRETVIKELESGNLTEALSKLEMYANQNNLPKLAVWARAERDGYFNGIIPEGIPDYRIVRVSWFDTQNREIRAGNIDNEEFLKLFNFMPIAHGVKDIEVHRTDFAFQPSQLLKTYSDILSKVESQRITLKQISVMPQFIDTLLAEIRTKARLKLQESIPAPSETSQMMEGKNTIDPNPDFSWILDPQLREIIDSRWTEAKNTLSVGAPLATTILLGSILEGLLLVMLQRFPKDANTATKAPRDKATSSVKTFDKWNLADMIDVALELKWIGKHLHTFSHSIRDYRNLVHPFKQKEENYHPDGSLCRISWVVIKEAVDELSKK